MNKKGSVGVVLALLVALVLIGGIGYYAYQKGLFAPKPTAPTTPGVQITVPTPTAPTAPTPTAEKFPVETLKATVKDKYTMADVSGVSIKFYSPGADITDPYVLPLDTITISSGTGTTTNYIIQTNTPYDVYLDGNTSYYDEKLNFEISYNKDRGVGYLLVNGQSYVSATNVGTFVDVDSLAEKSSAVQDTGTDTIMYNESVGAGSFWIKLDIGNDEANSELRDVVLCFRDVGTDALDGDEVTGLSATYVSGSSKINIPGDLLKYWQDSAGSGGAVCIKIADSLGSSEKARWAFDFTVDESNWDANEKFAITFDDLGDYQEKQYPSRKTKATAESLTITTSE